MRNLIAVLSVLQFCAAGASAAPQDENAKAAAAASWRGAVVDNDRLAAIIKNARVSVVGVVRAPDPDAAQARERESRERQPSSARIALRISGVCGGLPLAIRSWCPAVGDNADVVGGASKEIRVKEGARVELVLVNDPRWSEGQASFILTAADVIEDCNPDAFGRPKDLAPDEAAKCRDFPQFGVSAVVAPGESKTISFTADKAGRYKYYDGYSRSGYGLLTVEP